VVTPCPGALPILINPRSGSLGAPGGVDGLCSLLAQHGLDGELHILEHGSDATAVARSLIARHAPPVLVAAGGDGTVSAVAAAVANSACALGVLPAGTLNHFAKDAGIPLALPEAVAALAAGHQRRVDLAEVNGRPFVNNSSLGIYADVVHARQREQRRGRAKWIALARSIVAVLQRNPVVAVRVRAGGETLVQRAPFVFVGNNEYTIRGLHIGTRSRIDAGQIAVYVAARASRARLVWTGIAALFGLEAGPDHLRVFSGDEVWVETRRPEARVSIDGEVVTLASPFHFRSLPGALRLVVPETATSRS